MPPAAQPVQIGRCPMKNEATGPKAGHNVHPHSNGQVGQRQAHYDRDDVLAGLGDMADWIGAPWQTEEALPEPPWPDAPVEKWPPPAPLLRKSFVISKTI